MSIEMIAGLAVVVAGIVAGGTGAWLVAARRRAAAMTAGYESRLVELEARAGRAEAALADAQAALAVAQERRVAAETTAARLPELETALDVHRRQVAELTARTAELDTQLAAERRQTEEKLALLQAAEQRLADSFKALSHDALARNNDQFLKLAQENFAVLQTGARSDLDRRQHAIAALVKPVAERLESFDRKIGELEKARAGAYGQLSEQVANLLATQQALHSETRNLAGALRSSNIRGRWGELQLKRVVELAGMLEHCDFYTQDSFEDEGGRKRPDMTVRLPGGKSIVVDAKAPTLAYTQAAEYPAESTERARLMADFVRHVRERIRDLAKKSYWEKLESPEFVVLFLPGESFFAAALEHDASLIEDSFKDGVLLATPTTLIALLKAVAYGWRQEALAKNAREVSAIGKELYERINVLGRHFDNVGKAIDNSVKHYNKAVGALETRVLVSARKLQDHHVVAAQTAITEPAALTDQVRPVTKAELRPPTDVEN